VTQTPLLQSHHLDLRASMRRMARERFEAGYLNRALSDEYAFDTLRDLGKLGLHAMAVPAEAGGDGADALSIGLVCEELAYADQGVACQYGTAAVAHRYIASQAAPPVRDRWMPGLLAGEILCCVGLTEPGAGSDVASLTTRADPVDGGYVLHGEKTSITSAPFADIAVVFAKTDPAAGSRGVSAFIVPLDDTTISRQAFRDPGFRSVGRGSLAFDGTFVPSEHLLGDKNRGFHKVMELFDFSRTIIGLVTAGGAQRAMDMTAEYVTQRQTFGQPLSRNQGVSFPIAEHTARINMLRIFAYNSMALIDSGLPNSVEAATLKWLGPETALAAIRDAIAFHGHTGWSDELPLQAMFRDISAYLLADGAANIQKLLIARQVLGREAVDG
jgi:cyclohexanecarboxyl-CoA dehydrogenase